MVSNTSAETVPKNELVITRLFVAPIKKVWDAWTVPTEMMKWWGPKDFTAPIIKIDFNVEGKCLACMRSPDGKDYWSTGTYKEIIPQKKIVVTDSFADKDGNVVPASYYGMPGDFPLEMIVNISFEENSGVTKMTVRHIGMPAGTMQEQASVGWNQSFDKLANCLKQ